MDSSPSPKNKDDRDHSSSKSLSRGGPLNQYYVYNFGEAAGNTVGGPAYYYPGYPTDYYYLYCFSGSQGSTGPSPKSYGDNYLQVHFLRIWFKACFAHTNIYDLYAEMVQGRHVR